VIASRIRDGKVQVLLMTSRDTGRWISIKPIYRANMQAVKQPNDNASSAEDNQRLLIWGNIERSGFHPTSLTGPTAVLAKRESISLQRREFGAHPISWIMVGADMLSLPTRAAKLGVQPKATTAISHRPLNRM
jgi:hypothetical protein